VSRSPDGFRRNLALLIAVNDYGEGIPALQTPVRDAIAVGEMLEFQHGFELILRLQADATKTEALKLLQGLKFSLSAEDRLFVYFAGHGVALEGIDGPAGFFLLADARRGDNATYLPMAEFQSALERLPCRHVLTILDCCFAGAFRWSSYRNLELAPENIHRERYEWFVRDPAWQVIASAAHDEKALDVVAGEPLGDRGLEGRHSPFAAALLDGLKGEADLLRRDGSPDGLITATELFLYLEDRFAPRPGALRRQTPIFWPMPKHDKGQFLFLNPAMALSLAPAPALDASSNPWRGLQSYQTGHADLFFGRGAVAEQLAAMVLPLDTAPEADTRLTIVTGSSGSGKSSLARAGLIPRIADQVRVATMRPASPSPSPFANLVAALAPFAPEDSPLPDPLVLAQSEDGLERWLASWPAAQDLLLIVDQAEELITRDEGLDDLKCFMASIAQGLSAPNTMLRVLMTVRSDFEPQLAQFALSGLWARSRFLVRAMTQDELRRVIEGPAAVKVLRFESAEMVERLVNEVIQMPGALPLLSFALSEIYWNFLASGARDRMLSLTDYEALSGGVTGALKLCADRLHDGLDLPKQGTLRRILERMVSVEAGEFSRRRVALSELEASSPSERQAVAIVLGQLVDARLVVIDDQAGSPFAELAHDALITGWTRLHAWVREDAKRIASLRLLSKDAEQWSMDARHRAGLMWADAARREVVEDLRKHSTPGLNAQETLFASASLDRARRNRRTRQLSNAGLVVAVLVFAALAYVAREQRNQAVANEFALRSDNVRALSPMSALRFALKAYDARPSDAALLAIRRAIDDSMLTATRDMARTSASSADGTALALTDPSGIIHLLEAKSFHERRQFRTHGKLEALALSPDGRWLAAANKTPQVALWDTRSSTHISITGIGEVIELTPGRTGRYLAASSDEAVAIVDLRSRHITARLPLAHHIYNAVTFAPDDSTVVVCGDNLATVINTSTGSRVARFDVKREAAEKKRAWNSTRGGSDVNLIDHASFGRDPNLVITVGSHGQWRLWNIKTGEEVRRAQDFTLSGSRWAIVTPDGKSVVTELGNSGNAGIWDLATGSLVQSFSGRHTNLINALAVAPDGRSILTVGADRLAILWDLLSGNVLATARDDVPEMADAFFTADGNRFVTLGITGKAALWTVNERVLAPLDQASDWYEARFDDNAHAAIVRRGHTPPILWNVAAGRPDGSLAPDTVASSQVAIGGDGRTVVSIGTDGLARFWDTRPLRESWRFPGKFDFVALSASGRLAGLTNFEGDVIILDTYSRSVRSRAHFEQNLTNAVAFAPDEKSYALTGNDGSIVIAEVATGQLIQRVQASDRSVRRALFLNGGVRLAVTTDDNIVRIFSVAHPSAQVRLTGHTQRVSQLISGPEEKVLITLGDDRTLRIWDTDNGEMIRVLQGHGGAILDARIDARGTITAIDASGGIIQHRCLACLSNDRLLEEARKLVGDR